MQNCVNVVCELAVLLLVGYTVSQQYNNYIESCKEGIAYMPQELPEKKIFICYSHEDKALRERLEVHLSLMQQQGLISSWHDRHIRAGMDWAKEIDAHLEEAAVILLLISADFMASNYCYTYEMKRALERQEAGQAVVIPIILRRVDWATAPFAHLQALPTNGKPITSWKNRDEAFTDVAVGLRKVFEAALTPDHARTLKEYLHWLIATTSQLILPRVTGKFSISLENVYVALKGDKTSDYEYGQARALLDNEVIDAIHRNIGKAREEISDEEYMELRNAVLQNRSLPPSHMVRDQPGQQPTQFAEMFSLAQAFQMERRLIILGGPGSGKTTLIEWLALKLASALEQASSNQGVQRVHVPVKQVDPDLSALIDFIDLGPARLPILVRVANYAEEYDAKWQEQKRRLSLIDYLGLQPWRGEEPARNSGDTKREDIPKADLQSLFLSYIEQGQAVIFLDGLDELTGNREKITREIELFVSTIKGQGEPIVNGGNQVVITSRIAGYVSSPLRGEDLTHVIIEAMKRPAVEQFCRDMIAAVNSREGQNDEADQRQAQGLINAIYDEQNWRIRELASNPLLITMLALVYTKYGKLPQQRAGLYRETIEYLIEQVWKTTKLVNSIKNDTLIDVLSGVAAYIHEEQPSGLLRRYQLFDKITEYLPDKATSKEDVEKFISVVDDNVGVLAARGHELYGFLHLTFQEYLAGIHLVKDKQQAHQRILKYLDVPRWREPILLALGYIGKSDQWSQEDREHLLRELFNAPDPLKRFLPRMVLLVAKTIPELGQIEDSLVRDVVERLFTVYSDRELLDEYTLIQDQVEEALVTLRLYNQEGVDEALITFVEKNPTSISALAQLVSTHEWLTGEIVETLQRHIDHDGPERGWMVNRVLQNLVTPPAQQIELVEPRPPESPDVLYHKMRDLQEKLRKLESGELLAGLVIDMKVMYKHLAEAGEADFVLPGFGALNDDELIANADLETLQQALDVLKNRFAGSYLEQLQQALNALEDEDYRGFLLENIVEAENACKTYRLEYKRLNADYAIADAAYLERKKKQRQAARAGLSPDYLKLRVALKHNRDTLDFIRNDPIWLRLITAFYGGFGDYEAGFWSQEYRELSALVALDEATFDALISRNREYYIGRWGYPQTMEKITAYRQSGQNGNYKRISRVPEFQVDYIYRDTPLHSDLLNGLWEEMPASSLTSLFWEIWRDESALTEKRVDALVVLALLGQDVTPTLSQSFASERHANLAQRTLSKMAQIASSLEDAVVRSREEILRQIGGIGLPDADWIDFVQTVVKTLIVASKQPIDMKMLARKAPADARPLLEADTWFFNIVSSMTDSSVATDPLAKFSHKLKMMRQKLEQTQPKALAEYYSRAVSLAWRAPNVAAAPLLNFSHAWQLDLLAPESIDPRDISIDMLDGLASFYALDNLHPLYSSAFRTFVLMSFREHFQENPDLLPEALLLCLPYLYEEPHLVADLDQGFFQAEQPILYLTQKILQISDPFYRARAILRLLPYSTSATDTVLVRVEELIAQIQIAYDEIKDVHQKVVIMERFIRFYSPETQEALLEQLYTNACLIPHMANRVRALLRIARLFPTRRQPALLAEALHFTDTIGYEHIKAELLYLIGLKASPYPDIMASLYDQAQTLSTSWLRAKARGLLAAHLLQSSTTWAGNVQNQTLWTPLLVSASLQEICAHFMNTDSLESLWEQFAESPSHEMLFALLNQGAETGLILTHTAVSAIDTLITSKNWEWLHNLLPLLHSPSINDIGMIESWLRCSEAFIANHAALFITEASRKLTPRYIPHLLALLHGDSDRSRARVHSMIVNGTEHVGERNRALRTSILEPQALEMLVADSLRRDESGRRSFSTACWVTVDVIHDSPERLQRWVQDYSKHPTKNSVSKYILSDIEDITDKTLDVFLHALVDNNTPVQVRTALLQSVCVLAVTQTQKKKRKLFERIFPVLREMPESVLDTISVFPDHYKALVDAAKATLSENGGLFIEQPGIVTQAESVLPSSAKKLSSIIDPSDKILYSRLAEFGDTFFVPLYGIDPKIIEAADRVGQDPELFKTLLFWLRKSLHEFVYEGVNDSNRKLNALLSVVAEVAKRMPSTFANMAQPEIFEPLLIYAACHGDHWKSNCAAIELLGLLRFVSGRITQLLKYALKRHHAVQQATLNLIGNLQNLQQGTMTDLIGELCNEKMLYHESASVAYTVASILSLLARNVYLDQKQRLTIQATLAAAADDPRSRRGVYLQSEGGLFNDRLRIVLLCRLNQAIFQAMLETVGIL